MNRALSSCVCTVLYYSNRDPAIRGLSAATLKSRRQNAAPIQDGLTEAEAAAAAAEEEACDPFLCLADFAGGAVDFADVEWTAVGSAPDAAAARPPLAAADPPSLSRARFVPPPP